MNTSSGENQHSIPVICANSCGFYGSAATNNLCSKCYKAFTRMKQQNVAADQSVKTEPPISPGTPPFSATNCSESTESSLNCSKIEPIPEGNAPGTHLSSSPSHFHPPEVASVIPLSSPTLKEQLLQVSSDGTRVSRAAPTSGPVASSSASAVQGTCTPSSGSWLPVSEGSDSSTNRIEQRSGSGSMPNQSIADASAVERSSVSLNPCHPPSCDEPTAFQQHDNNNEESSSVDIPVQQLMSRSAPGDPVAETDCSLSSEAQSSGLCAPSEPNCERGSPEDSSISGVNSSSASALPTSGSGQQNNNVQVNKSRCYQCKKKVGLLGFQCRCGFYFCGAHRHADLHACAFDFMAFGKQQLRKSNQKVVADKLNKL